MTPARLFFIVVALGAFLSTRLDGAQPDVVKPAKKAVDAQGDPLPDGVLLRIGTTRLRHASAITSLVFSPDGQTLASSGGYQRHADNAVRVWSLSDGKLLMEGLGDDVAALDFTPDGKTLASASHYGTIRLWNVASGRRVKEFAGHVSAGATSTQDVRFSPDGKFLSLTDNDGHVFRRDITSDEKPSNFRVERHHWFRMGLSADGKLVSACGEKHAVSIWDVQTGKQLLALPPHKDYVYAAVFSPDGRYLASGGRSNHVHLWELATGQIIYTLPSQDSVFAFAPDGRTLATCGSYSQGDVHLWDLATGKERRVLRHRRGAACLAFSRDGRLLATGSGDGVVRVWDHATGQEILATTMEGGAPSAFIDNGRVLAVNATSGLVFHDLIAPGKMSKTWNAREQFRLDGVHGQVSADGKTIVSAGSGSRGSVTVWDVAKKVELRNFGGRDHSGYGIGYAVAPGSQHVAVASWPAIEIFSIATGKSVHKLEGHKGSRGVSLAFSPDGKTLVSAGSERGNSLHFWDAVAGKSIRQVPLPSDRDYDSYPPTLGFSPIGTVLAIGGQYRGLQLWDAVKGAKAADIKVSGTFAFSPDGRLLATAGASGSVQLWEVATAKPVAELRGHAGSIVSLVFAPDGQTLATGATDHTTLLWDVRLQRLFASSKPVKLDAADRLRAWNALSNPDALTAYAAMARLAAHPAESVAFLREKIKPVASPEAKQIAKWVKDLSDDTFEVRDRATTQLRNLGRIAEQALRDALEAKPGLEATRRIERLLAELGNDELGLSGERLRTYRAVQLLEIAGTAPARQVLEALAAGASRAAETEMAKAALLRLAKQPSP